MYFWNSYGNARPNEPQEWYYPIHSSSDSDEPELPAGVKGGNWGKKNVKGARWVRRGKATPWGPSRGEWEVRLIAPCHAALFAMRRAGRGAKFIDSTTGLLILLSFFSLLLAP